MSILRTRQLSGSVRRRAMLLIALVVVIGVTLPVALTQAAGSVAVTNYAKFVGVKPGKANPKLKPVVIGLVNLQGGQVQVGPLWTPAVETTVKFANSELGGAAAGTRSCSRSASSRRRGGRHEVRPGDGERQARLGRLWGGIVIGNQSFYSALGNKPVVGGVLVHPIDEAVQADASVSSAATRPCSARTGRLHGRAARQDGRGRLPDYPGHRRGWRVDRRCDEEGRAVRETGRLRPEHDRPRRSDHGGRWSERRRVRAAGRRLGCVNMAKALAQLHSPRRCSRTRSASTHVWQRGSVATTRSGRSRSRPRSAST